ncbi:hypothetical protein EDB85DRAFT_2142705 [Lactarius pseudohatsudake]|nr:hypothetical protein EDB85DRAFT_2142705 [Lactarius pseudohatsudake]
MSVHLASTEKPDYQYLHSILSRCSAAEADHPGEALPSPTLSIVSPGREPVSSDRVLFKKPLRPEKYAREGTYRIVQAPLSYSFRLLRAVILFIFSGDPSAPPRAPGHLFSVQHGISIGSPGEITRGRVWVKLSCAQDPYYSSRSLADLIAAADAQGQDEEDLEDEDASWQWEGKDDLTLGHVWDIRSRDPKRGIIYHHGGKTSVHITLNTQTVQHRKGVGNMPFVFRTYGTAHLDPPRSPPSTPAPGAGSTSTHPYLPGAFSRHTGAVSRARSSSWTRPTPSQSCRPPFALFHPRICFFTSTLTAAPSQRPFVQKMSTQVLLVTLPDEPTACCHLQHRSLTFLCPISGDLDPLYAFTFIQHLPDINLLGLT